MASEAPCLCGALRRLTRAVTARYDEALRPAGLRITQFSILRTLERIGPVAVTRLAAEAALDRSTMGRNLDPLERRGLVRLGVGKSDGRERIVHLTEAGAAALGAALPFWREVQARLADEVPPNVLSGIAERIATPPQP